MSESKNQFLPVAVQPRHPLVWFLFVVFAVLMSWAIWTTSPLQSANDRSRWCTVWSLVERGTYQIDEIDQVSGWSTIDKVRHQPAGSDEYHFYSSKPPLFSTMVAGLYWVQKTVWGYDLRQQTQTTAQSLLLIINLLPFCFALLAFEKSLRVLQLGSIAAAVVFGIAAFTSMLNPFLTTLNNHTPAATSLLFCLAGLIRLQVAKSMSERPATKDFVIVGWTAALVCCFELPAALFGLLSFVVVVQISFRKTLIAYAPAALIPLAAFFITNVICTDGIKPFYAYYGTEKYEYVHEGVPSYWVSPKGIDANAEHPAVYLFHCVVGHHGLLSLTPVFLLAFPGWWFIFRGSQPKGWKLIGAMGVFLSVVILAFYLTRTKNYNYGGNTSGLRWILWLVPFWWYALARMIGRSLSSKLGMVCLLLLTVASGFSSMASLRTAWKPNWIYQTAARQGWIDYRTNVARFRPERMSVLNPAALLPQGARFRFGGSEDVSGRAIVLEVLEAPESVQKQIAAGDVVVLKVQLEGKDEQVLKSSEVVLFIDVLKSGAKLDSALKSWSAATADAQSDLKAANFGNAEGWVLRTLQGLSIPKAYQAASERYLKYRDDDGSYTAIRCDRGAARVRVQHPEEGFVWQQCDVFYCDDLAFGVARWSVTLTSEQTGKIIRKETWTCRELP
ncbi:MAG: hypothetical protein ABJZ55_21470 [Fuerstiella sp.]